MAIDNNIRRAKVQLMMLKPFYGSLAARLQLIEGTSYTFQTDGSYIYCPATHPYDEDQLESVVAHEVLHCALLHLFRRGERDPMRWNYACDYAVNSMLKEDGFRLHEKWLYDKKYKGLTAEKIYEILPKNISMANFISDLLEQFGKNEDGTPKSAEQMERDWREIVVTAAEKNRGNTPGGMQEFIDEFYFTKIPWQQILYRFLQDGKGNNDFTAYPFNRAHIYREVFLPSMTGDYIEVVVGIDTSGSMSTEDLRWAFGETRALLSSFGEYKVYFYQFDCAIHETKEIEADSDMPTMAVGRGGTSFVPMFDDIEAKELDNLPIIVFTDLDGEMPKREKQNVYWMVLKGGYHSGHTPPFGTVIEMER